LYSSILGAAVCAWNLGLLLHVLVAGGVYNNLRGKCRKNDPARGSTAAVTGSDGKSLLDKLMQAAKANRAEREHNGKRSRIQSFASSYFTMGNTPLATVNNLTDLETAFVTKHSIDSTGVKDNHQRQKAGLLGVIFFVLFVTFTLWHTLCRQAIVALVNDLGSQIEHSVVRHTQILGTYNCNGKRVLYALTPQQVCVPTISNSTVVCFVFYRRLKCLVPIHVESLAHVVHLLTHHFYHLCTYSPHPSCGQYD
jgi:hypothetical protein